MVSSVECEYLQDIQEDSLGFHKPNIIVEPVDMRLKLGPKHVRKSNMLTYAKL